MFTGITRGTYAIVELQRRTDLLRYSVELDARLLEGLQLGASVSIDGVCQTVVELDGHRVLFEAIRETLDRTTLSELSVGSRVSVERSFRVGDEIGGHEVSGHVTGTGTISSCQRDGDVQRLTVSVPADWMKYVLAKGFVAIDGSSLTVSDPDPGGRFELHLIPETLRLTNLGSKQVGDHVNVELDSRTVAIVDTVERVMAARQG